jgi:uncharacterized hydrophobic protein (TIGR00271 family)
MYSFMRRVLATPLGHELYRQRQITIEPVFGQIKFNRAIKRFQRRGRTACRSEWRLIAERAGGGPCPSVPPRSIHRAVCGVRPDAHNGANRPSPQFPADSMSTSTNILRRVAGKSRPPDEIRDAVYLRVGDVAGKQSRFWLLLVLATGIATAGVLSDSTATVIGAMIIAPLATPIQGVALGIALGEIRPLLQSAATLVLAVAVVVGLAAALAWVLPDLKPLSDNSQVSGRVSPTLIDLVAAAFTGLAGSFAVTRRDIGDILPGVAIAISLVPPLAVVGVTMIAGDWSGALGASLLFLTNVLAIILLGAAVFSTVQARQRERSQHGIRRVYSVVVPSAAIVLAALAVTTYRTVRLSNWQQAATRVGSDWAREHGERLVTTRFEGDSLVLVVEGLTSGSQDPELLHLLSGAVPDGTPIVVNRVPGARTDVGDVGG